MMRACTLAVLGTLTASAQAQESVPKPTEADAAKIVKIISADKTKTQNYCKLVDIGVQVKKAGDAGDNSKIEQFGKQADGLIKTLGPEFIRLEAGLDDVAPQSKEAKELSAELDKLCPSK